LRGTVFEREKIELKRIARYLLVCVLALLALGIPQNNIEGSNGGTISGHVFAGDGVTPLAGVSVVARPNSGGSEISGTSNANGVYTISNLSAGYYLVRATASDGYVLQYYWKAATSPSATPVYVSSTGTTSNVDFEINLSSFVAPQIVTPDRMPTGARFSIQVSINQVNDFKAFEFFLNFDSTVLRIEDVRYGIIGSTMIDVSTWAQIEPGKHRISGQASSISGISGSGYLAEIDFTAIGTPGQTCLISMDNGLLYDSEGWAFNRVIWLGDSVELYPRGDVNTDGILTMGDVVLVERMVLGLAEPDSSGDANLDGDVTMGDVIAIEYLILGIY